MQVQARHLWSMVVGQTGLYVGAISLALLTLTALLGKAIPHGAGELAFTAGPLYEIYLLDVATGLEHNLTHRPGDDVWPVWSPDGSQIAFTASPGLSNTVYLIASTGGSAQRLSQGGRGDSNVTWIPASDHVTFQATRMRQRGIFLIDTHCADVERGCWMAEQPFLDYASLPGDIGERSRYAGFLWSPDGSRLALIFDPDRAIFGDEALHVIETRCHLSGECAVQRPSESIPGAVLQRSYAWSADSRKLAFTMHQPQAYTGEVYVFEVATGPVQRLAQLAPSQSSTYFIRDVAWLPGDTTVSFALETCRRESRAATWGCNYHSRFQNTSDYHYTIYAVNSDGSDLHELATIGKEGVVEEAEWSPDGSQIAFILHDSAGFNVYLLDAACADSPVGCNGQLRPLTHGPSNRRGLAWRP